MEHCNRCTWPITEEDPRVTLYKGDKIQEVICTECDRDEMRFIYRKTKNITSRLAMEALMVKLHIKDRCRYGTTYEAVNADLEKVDELIEAFGEKVWLQGLHAAYHKFKTWGVIAVHEEFKFLFACSAGRCMIQLEDADGNYVSMITTDDDKEPKPPGRQGINATVSQIAALFEHMFAHWNHEHRFNLIEDKEVGIA